MLSIPSTTSSTTPPIHILYTIHDSETNTQTQRRYSAFHSLHALLTQLYPAAIVPPMPGKTGMWKKGEEKEEDFTEKRRRGLQRFLRRCSVNNILRESPYFKTFIAAGAWAESITSTTSPSIANGAPGTAPKITIDALTSFTSAPKNRASNPKFAEYEMYINRFSKSLTNCTRVSQRIVKKYEGIAADLSELGASYNAFSLHETTDPVLAAAIEKIGQAVDTTYSATDAYAHSLQEGYLEPIEEYEQYGSTIKSGILKLRSSLALHQDHLLESLDVKRSNLQMLEGGGDVKNMSGDGILNKVRGSVGSLLETDPEERRRRYISKLRSEIETMESDRELTSSELARINNDVEVAMSGFAAERGDDLRKAILEFVKGSTEMTKKNLDAWEEAKRELEKIQ